MGKYPQNRFRRLVIVDPADNKPRTQSAAPRWWGPWRSSHPRLNQIAHATWATRAQSKPIRMAVMPTLSRGLWLEALTWIWSFLRGYFVPAAKRQRGAVILPFRRHGMPGFRQPLEEEAFVSKKANGSVRWNSDREVAPQEGGRG
jgi:hypothetical protein